MLRKASERLCVYVFMCVCYLRHVFVRTHNFRVKETLIQWLLVKGRADRGEEISNVGI